MTIPENKKSAKKTNVVEVKKKRNVLYEMLCVLLRMKDKKLIMQLSIIGMLAVFLLMLFLAVILFIIQIIIPPPEHSLTVVLVMIMFSMLLGIVLYFIFSDIKYLIHVLNISLIIICLFTNFFRPKKGIRNLPAFIIMGVGCGFSVLFLEQTFFHIFYITINIVILIAAMIIEVIFKFEVVDDGLLSTTVGYYFALIFTQVSSVLVAIILKRVIIKDTKNVLKVCQLVSVLDFESDFIQKMVKKNDYHLNKTMVYLKRIVLIIKKYKAYLPASLYHAEITNSNNSSFSKLKKGSIDTFNESNISSSDSSYKSDKSNKSDCSTGSNKTVERKEFGLIKKSIVIMKVVMLINNDKISMQDLENIHSNFVDFVEKNSKSHRGFIHSMRGFELILAWNTLSLCINPSVNCCAFAQKLQEKFGNVIISIMEANNIYCGNMGSENFKRYGFIGKELSRLEKFSEFNCQYIKSKKYISGEDVRRVFITESINSEAKYGYLTTPAFFVSFSEEKKDLFLVFNILKKKVKKKTTKLNEWNYEISEFLDDNVTMECVIKLIKKGFYLAALKKYNMYKKKEHQKFGGGKEYHSTDNLQHMLKRNELTFFNLNYNDDFSKCLSTISSI